jgi:hypothetical protein
VFETVKKVGRTLPGIEVGRKYDGSEVLRVDGCFVAGMATHPSAERDTLVVRADVEQRDDLLADCPHAYYLTDYYRRHPVVLVRLPQIDAGALRDLLRVSLRLTLPKTRAGRRPAVKI